MSLYRIYIDETGNHDMTHADDPNERFLSLTGVILESDYITCTLQPEMDAIKRKFFQNDPDEPVILHRKEIINRRKPFHILWNQEIEKNFNQAMLEALRRWEFKVITVVIDKKTHRDRYTTWRYHPYHYCLAVMLERFVLFLHYQNHRGDVMVEARGGKEDAKLKDSYRRLYDTGTENVPAELFQDKLTSSELKVKSKTTNIAGLQLADLIAHPSRREILLDNKLITDKRETFGDKIRHLLFEEKYLRSQNGTIQGYGKKLLP